MLLDVITWRRVEDARVMALGEGAVLRVAVGGKNICFARSNGQLYALGDSCPHQGKSFAGGHCEDGFLICPWHRMAFDPATGRNRSGATANAETFPLEHRADGLYIGLPGTGFSLFGIRLW